MSLLREVLGELAGMFLADLRLTAAVTAAVALAAFLNASGGAGWLVGLVLTVGPMAAIMVAVLSAARRR